MIKALIAFKKAIAEISLGKFLQFVFSYDVLATYDEQHKSVSKFESDGTDVDDEALLEFTSRKADPVNLADEITQVYTQKTIKDFLQLSDVFSFAKSQHLSTTSQINDIHSVVVDRSTGNDTVIDDSTVISVARLEQEPLDLADSLATDNGKSLNDDQGASDAIRSTLDRILSDFGDVLDSAHISYGSYKQDSELATDEHTTGFLKVLQDTANLVEEHALSAAKIIQGQSSGTDLITIQDQAYLSLATQTSDDAAANDSHLIVAGKVISDTMGSQDSGSMRAQDYAAFDYFSEDYVGFSQTF